MLHFYLLWMRIWFLSCCPHFQTRELKREKWTNQSKVPHHDENVWKCEVKMQTKEKLSCMRTVGKNTGKWHQIEDDDNVACTMYAYTETLCNAGILKRLLFGNYSSDWVRSSRYLVFEIIKDTNTENVLCSLINYVMILMQLALSLFQCETSRKYWNKWHFHKQKAWRKKSKKKTEIETGEYEESSKK